jgi:hypothetical protein
MQNTSAQSIPSTFVDAPRVGDFENVINLLSVLGEANRQLDALTRQIEVGYIALVNPQRERYAKLQGTVTETEAALEVIARRNPQWFDDKKSVTTPFGGVKFTKSSELVVADENISVQLVLALAGKDGAAKYLRTVQVLNKEALDELTDAELAKFGVLRKAKENFKAATDVVNLGKAVKAAERSDKAAAKTAKKAAETVGGGS